tara:strand:+ start:60 stop:680 length:621 start_codon:yes stop_codon:yes gene_type:complete
MREPKSSYVGTVGSFKFDTAFIKELNLLSNSQEGSTFGWFSKDRDSQMGQIEFHKKILTKLNPSVILEIGTHKANYCYMAKTFLPDVKIYTFGIDDWSKKCVNAVNSYFKENFITFIHGSSIKTLPLFETTDKIDLAWVDGDHSKATCLSDLKQCDRLNINNIMIDDYRSTSNVNGAVKIFIKGTDYKFAEESTNDYRGICYINNK